METSEWERWGTGGGIDVKSGHGSIDSDVAQVLHVRWKPYLHLRLSFFPLLFVTCSYTEANARYREGIHV